MRRLALTPVLVLVLVLAACQERLTQPGECPELCPGGGPPAVIEEVLDAIPGLDSTFSGFVERNAVATLLISSGVPEISDTARGVLVFGPVPDSIRFRDTLRSYVVDSVLLAIAVRARDTLVDGLVLDLYRLPGNLDTTTVDYANTAASFAPPGLIATIPVADTLRTGTAETMLRGADVARVALTEADNDRLAIGVVPRAPSPTGARLGAEDVVPARVQLFVTPVVENTTTQNIELSIEFDTYVTNYASVPDPNLLSAGSTPSARSLIRFPFPQRLRDSAAIVRATLTLGPVRPIRGLPNDPGAVTVLALTADLGAKSPVEEVAGAQQSLVAGSSDPVEVEITRLAQAWQGPNGRPPAVFLRIVPEAATFTEATFGSTRAGTIPRIRLEYLRAFPFERP